MSAPELLSLFSRVLAKLEETEVPYMVVGSIASMVYGEPRLTHDMDLVIDILPKDAKKLTQLFSLDEFYCPPVEVVLSEVTHRGQFNLIHAESGLKIDLMIRKDTEHARVEFSRRQRTEFWEGQSAMIASAEDVILKKLDFFRQGGSEKHIHDVRGILAETEIDHDYLMDWVVRLGLSREWDRVK